MDITIKLLVRHDIAVLFIFFKFYVFLNNSFFPFQPVQEPEKMTQIIVDALEKTGQRGIINKGWGGLGNCKCFFFLFLDLKCL